MKRIRCFSRLILGFAILLGPSGMTGCSPEGAGSAPKLKGSKDEIQKATQSGVPGKKGADGVGGKRQP